MPLEEIVHRVEARFLDIGAVMLQADPDSQAREDLEILRADTDRETDRLATLLGQVALLTLRIEENQSAASLLPAEVESSVKRGKSSQAMRQALELDRLRRDLATDQAELRRLDHSVWCVEFRLRQLDRRMQRLREGLARK